MRKKHRLCELKKSRVAFIRSRSRKKDFMCRWDHEKKRVI